jgi:membrane fusion protein (multidrug efflux system)
VSIKDFELEVDVNQEYLDILKVGEPVLLTDLAGEREWEGKVRRINGRLNQATQSVKVFIGVSGEELIEGMYMEANIAARSEQNAIEIQRSLLQNENQLFAVEDGQLVIKEVLPVYYTDRTVVIKGLKDGTQILSRPVPGAYNGMLVKISPSSSTIAQ